MLGQIIEMYLRALALRFRNAQRCCHLRIGCPERVAVLLAGQTGACAVVLRQIVEHQRREVPDALPRPQVHIALVAIGPRRRSRR